MRCSRSRSRPCRRIRGRAKARSKREKARAKQRVEERICSVPVVFSPRYRIDIGAHVFPTSKYSLVHARLLESGMLLPSTVVEPEPASWRDLALVHTPEYLARMRDGTLTADDLADLQLPWSVDIVEGFRTMVGGTLQAAR